MLFAQLILAACGDLDRPKTEPYYAAAVPPRQQEFRWSNGKLPKSLDPARAATAPETDLVRAVSEGLTEIDPLILKERPAVAEKWASSDGFRSWTFHLRPNARWWNGKAVTAGDFVRSWKRLGDLGQSAAHPDLLANIVGFPTQKKDLKAAPLDLLLDSNSASSPQPFPVKSAGSPGPADSNSSAPHKPAPASFGVTAVDDVTLRVLLIAPDKDFPRLVANPFFRPVYGDGSEFAENSLPTNIVTNGPFRIAATDAGGVVLERSDIYWNRAQVKLERVRLVATENAEQALAAYKAGDIDAITNAEFEPLALKLLEPFEDFRRWTHAALNFYEINHEKAPFDDRRVREALALAIERERLTEGEMEGVTRPALSFLPFTGDGIRIVQDKERGRGLMEEAGFPNGEGFPVVSLVINRNDTQQRIARAVARMWKQNLNIETEIVVKELAELEAARFSGDYDLVRRNIVFASADELMSILAILKPARPDASGERETRPAEGLEARPASRPNKEVDVSALAGDPPDPTMTEANALYEMWAIPLYFPTSYSLVKPYVSGFEMNSLGAPLLSDVAIDGGWQPK